MNNDMEKQNKKKSRKGIDIAILVLGTILTLSILTAVLDQYFASIPKVWRDIFGPVMVFVPIIILLVYLRNKKDQK